MKAGVEEAAAHAGRGETAASIEDDAPRRPVSGTLRLRVAKAGALGSVVAVTILALGFMVYFLCSAHKSDPPPPPSPLVDSIHGMSGEGGGGGGGEGEGGGGEVASLQTVEEPKLHFFLQFVADNSKRIIVGSIAFGLLVVAGSLAVLLYFRLIYYNPQVSIEVPQQSQEVIDMLHGSKPKGRSGGGEETGGGFESQLAKYLWLLPHALFLLYISGSTVFIAWREPADRLSVVASLFVFVGVYVFSLFTFDPTGSFHDFCLSLLSNLKWTGCLGLAYFFCRLLRGGFKNVWDDVKATLSLFKNFAKVLFPFYTLFYVLRSRPLGFFRRIKARLRTVCCGDSGGDDGKGDHGGGGGGDNKGGEEKGEGESCNNNLEQQQIIVIE